MPRQLRSRPSRLNYAALHTGEEVEDYIPDPEELESVSEFSANGPNTVGNVAGTHDEARPDAEGPEGESDVEASPSSKVTPQVKASRPKSRGPSTRPPKSTSAVFSKRNKSTLPTTHHRHRPPPLFRRDAQVERLLGHPTLFQPSATVLTNSFTSSTRATKRLERSWGRNVGPGPVHELLEDRAWFKEAVPDASVASEAGRRPVVYDTVKLDGRYHVISEGLVF
jgi:transcription factor C subunit 6